MFEIASHSPPSGPGNDTGSIRFAYESGHVKGGWQGGRGWDKQSPHLADADKPGYIVAGGWMIQGAKSALDHPNEWWFDEEARQLYVWPVVDPIPGGASRFRGALPAPAAVVAGGSRWVMRASG